MQNPKEQTPPSDEVWKDLNERFRGPLTAYFHRRLREGGDAEDLAQEVFVRLAARPDRHNGLTLEAYVFTIASSVLTDWRRSRNSRRAGMHQGLVDNDENVTVPSILVEDRTPERVLAGKDALKDLEKGLAELSDRTREIFLLVRMEHIQHRDIARQFGISVSAVEKHVLKAIAHLSARNYK